MNSSMSATESRCDTEMLRLLDWVQRMPSSSQCSQKIPRMSSDSFEKKYRGYSYAATRPLGSLA